MWSSPEYSPPCHGGDHGFKSRRGRWHSTVRKPAKRRSSNLRDFVGSTPTRATVRVVFLTAACKPVVAKEVRWKTRGSIPSQPTGFLNGPFVYRHRTPASHAGKAGSTPARVTAQHGQVVEFGRHATLRRSCPQGRASSTLALATGRDDCRWAGAQPALMRPVRPDRYRDLQLDI